jgi:glucokinase
MRTIVGVDVGGTKVSVATLRDGEFGDPRLSPTVKDSTERFVAEVVAAVRAVGGDELDGVGIGVPSVIEFATGRVRTTVNIPALQDVPLRQVLETELGVPVFVDNDATVAALAEAHDEHAGLETGCLVMLTLGTGVGGGIVIGGRPYRGATGAAGELGHTLIGIEHSIPPATDHFPQPSSLEALAAGHALDILARTGSDASRAREHQRSRRRQRRPLR